MGRSSKGRVAALGILIFPEGARVPSLTHDGLERKYVLHIPGARAGDAPRPLLHRSPRRARERPADDEAHSTRFQQASVLPAPDPDDGTRARREVYLGGREGSAVELWRIEGGGHTWPGGRRYLGEDVVGRTSRAVDACGVIWEFFKGNARG